MEKEVFQPVRAELARRLAGGSQLVIAIDGRCGSGKTTLGAMLQQEFGGNLFHTDDFYLPFEKRSPDWEQVATRNMDFNRLREEVLLPVSRGERVSYGAYDPMERRMRNVTCAPAALSILEGSYSQHPILRGEEDFLIFLTCDPQIQAERLLQREGEQRFKRFKQLWIPLEEQYFREYRIEERCDMVICTDAREERS